ncbi:glycosyltransferase [Acetobacter fallax]|uniref:glycosyltransferase n=1 Tax=Acetobacter fallax TaxID=1737473 RepID=UPI00156A841F|nr:glycosyltransferase [Acetobacter fallax]
MRADGLATEAAHNRHMLLGWNSSRTARLSRVIRTGWLLCQGMTPSGQSLRKVTRRAAEVAETEGVGVLYRRVKSRVWARLEHRLAIRKAVVPTKNTSPAETGDVDAPYMVNVPSARLRDLRPRILIVAELTLPQCAKYRVWQRKEELELLNWQVDVTDWRDVEASLTALQTCTEVIFYRVPAFPSVKSLFREVRRLGLLSHWEVDDLIFDAAEYRQNGNLATLSDSEQRELLFGVGLFLDSLQSCGRGIASTRALGEAMRRAGIEDVHVIENALDRQTIALADALRIERSPDDVRESFLIVYGSGTRTHDADFRCCADGLVAAMEAEPRLSLQVIGELTLPDEFRRFGSRVQQLQGRDYPAYMALLARADLTIAPLEPTLFNDAKSNIKFLEAAVLDVPAVCSPRDAFTHVVRNGENGLLAEGTDAWRDAVLDLCRDPALRARLGRQAREDVLKRYRPEDVAREQVALCFPEPVADLPEERPLRVMSANIYFAPRSFGGATLIAEEMVRQLSGRGMDLAVFTSAPFLDGRHASSIRYEEDGAPVVATPLSIHIDRVAGLDNPRCSAQFSAWLDAFRPDVVHFHSVQGLGLGLTQLCLERRIPYVITLHDAWWLCERQFMVRQDGRYCFQRHIDLKVCAMCVPEARHLGLRADMMNASLKSATLLLTPSQSHRALYMENGIAADRIKVNRNGFAWPKTKRTPRKSGMPLRFGYVGGAEAVKGYPLIRKAFEALDQGDWELVLIDNKLNLGFSSIHADDWKVQGSVKVLPAYSQDTMDAFYEQIDVLLFPSQWMESYGLTVREALARDVWVISTSPGGQAEDIVDGVNGTLIPLDGRPESLRSAVEGVLAQKERFDDYNNPLKSGLPTFEGQAVELMTFLESVVRPKM